MSPDLKFPLDVPSGVQGSKVRLGTGSSATWTWVRGIFVLLIMASIGAFLEAVPAFQNNTGDFFTTQQWFPDADPPIFGIAALAFGTAISVIAMLIAVPSRSARPFHRLHPARPRRHWFS